MDEMTPAETAALLRQFNEWRRGDYETIEQPDPHEVSEAIDLNARQASAFRPGKESAKPVRASSGATDQSAAVAQEHQPCELFPIASA